MYSDSRIPLPVALIYRHDLRVETDELEWDFGGVFRVAITKCSICVCLVVTQPTKPEMNSRVLKTKGLLGCATTRQTHIGHLARWYFLQPDGQLHDELCAFSGLAIHRYISFMDRYNP